MKVVLERVIEYRDKFIDIDEGTNYDYAYIIVRQFLRVIKWKMFNVHP